MIGIFDSGIGGLLVAAEIERQWPGLPLVYVNDTARAPLATKSMDTITAATRHALNFLVQQGASLLVLAGSTAAGAVEVATTGDFSQPLLSPIAAAVDQALATSCSGRIGLVSGPAAIACGSYEKDLRGKSDTARLFSVSCPLLPALVEGGWSKKRETKMILRRYLAPLKQQQVDTLILGCGHCSLLHPLIQARIGRRVRLIDGSQALARSLLQMVSLQPEKFFSDRGTHGEQRFFVSDRNPTFDKLAALILARPVEFLPW
jgi:glutamate racemase